MTCASDNLTFLGITVSKTLLPRCSLASATTSSTSLFLLSNIVKITPSSKKDWGLNSLYLSIVLKSWANPSKAKTSHCNGTITELEATKEFTVNMPKEGGQSIRTKSYSAFKSLILLLNLSVLLSSVANSNSIPDKLIFEGIIFKFGILVFCIVAYIDEVCTIKS